MKFIHVADIHLDSPLRGLDRYDGAPVDQIRGATRKALENMVSLAIEEEVDFVVIAGDLFDGDWPDFNTGLFFVRQMVRLGEKGIRVFAVRGNHDAESKMSRKLPWPQNVHFFSSKKPESITIDNLDVVIHGQSFANQKVTDDLALGYPAAVPGKINVGILHTSLDGRPGHATYAPTRLEVLKSKGYDYWALGHIHKREIVSNEPLVVFPGNTQGRHIKETETKGCELVTLESGGLRTEHRPLDVLRWKVLDIEISGATDFDEVLERTARSLDAAVEEAEDRLSAVRVRFIGRGVAHNTIASKPETMRQQVRARAIERGSGSVWVEKVVVETSAAVDLAALKARSDPVGELLCQLESIKTGEAEPLGALAEELQALRQKLPAELTEEADGIRLGDPEYLRTLLADIEPQLIPRIMNLESGP
ncbi:MAG TPA: DNA repair exonuclease [Acidiferrobacterales bacterium]|nr:DNA repair exonuclease [Acidiferrobacterales bacterium]